MFIVILFFLFFLFFLFYCICESINLFQRQYNIVRLCVKCLWVLVTDNLTGWCIMAAVGLVPHFSSVDKYGAGVQWPMRIQIFPHILRWKIFELGI